MLRLLPEHLNESGSEPRTEPASPKEIDAATFADWLPLAGLPERAAPASPAQARATQASPAPASPGRPWVFTNMIVSVAGGYSLNGVSRPLGCPTDRALLQEFRKHADVLLIGRKTAEAEDYGRPTARTTAGEHAPRLALVSSSPQRCSGMRLFEPSTGAGDPLPIVITSSSAAASSSPASLPASFVPLRSLSDPAPAVLDTSAAAAGTGAAGTSSVVPDSTGPDSAGTSTAVGVDFGFALAELGRLGAKVVLCEGGPSINAQLFSLGLIDEINLTVSPVIAPPDAVPASTGPANTGPTSTVPTSTGPGGIGGGGFQLVQLASEDAYLFLRYVRRW